MDRSGVASAADAGRLGPVERTPGGHRRFNPATVAAELRARGATVPPKLEEMAAANCPASANDPDLHRLLRRGTRCADCGHEGTADIADSTNEVPRAAGRPEHRVRVKGAGR
jgi:hypothetical protein